MSNSFIYKRLSWNHLVFAAIIVAFVAVFYLIATAPEPYRPPIKYQKGTLIYSRVTQHQGQVISGYCRKTHPKNPTRECFYNMRFSDDNGRLQEVMMAEFELSDQAPSAEAQPHHAHAPFTPEQTPSP
jgi:hypothetical protein